MSKANKNVPSKVGAKVRSRFGIGEWYGKLFVSISPEERNSLAKIQAKKKKERPTQICPFRTTAAGEVPCNKEGGVCSIRLYEQDPTTGSVTVAQGRRGSLVTTCPQRFKENRVIYKWIGQKLLGHPDPLIVGEVGFLEQDSGGNSSEDVGRIDNVLVRPHSDPMLWCALEIQAVYFSGTAMGREFKFLETSKGQEVPFPVANRRPDYRSSGPKRLQIKVPTLRRWGKKMAVVVDRSFFEALGAMDEVRDVSNCDIAWFVVAYEVETGRAILKPDFVRLTTLERAVEGLTGGDPVSVGVFEERIHQKLAEKAHSGSANRDPSQ